MYASRRFVLGGLASLTFLPVATSLQAQAGRDPRFVLVILRGGMDGLSAVPPYGDPGYTNRRGGLRLPGPGGGSLKLDGMFALHPSLASLHGFYQRGELAVLHAMATPYRARSHFDGQDLLENGTARPQGARDGWLNRALIPLDNRGDRDGYAIAVAGSTPLVLRGGAKTTSWAPSAMPAGDEDTLARISALYERDPLLGPALASAMATSEMASEVMQGGDRGRRRGNPARQFAQLCQAAGRFLSDPEGPRVAVLELGGWDTHANQGTETGRLANNLTALDGGLAKLAETLETAWPQTVVAVVTEFGRTVAENGTRGTDHGTAGAGFVLGGSVAGGQVAADWPGLGPGDLHEGRDLRPTLDMRSVFKEILAEHLGVAPAAIDRDIFPDSAEIAPLSGLIRL